MMPKKPRLHLCVGCLHAPPEGVVDGTICCQAAGEVVPAVPHTKGRRFESCHHRLLAKPLNAAQSFLVELAREVRKLDNPSQVEIEQLEQRLRRRRG